MFGVLCCDEGIAVTTILLPSAMQCHFEVGWMSLRSREVHAAGISPFGDDVVAAAILVSLVVCRPGMISHLLLLS